MKVCGLGACTYHIGLLGSYMDISLVLFPVSVGSLKANLPTKVPNPTKKATQNLLE